ncbi:DUF192 domain-containing protein [Candidatus Peregrinibacteria bacterium]|nr:DUF192 domain-containing protein [Candidatus Peregrinibacteria bacterium]
MKYMISILTSICVLFGCTLGDSSVEMNVEDKILEDEKVVTINTDNEKVNFIVEIADTIEKRQEGLMFREELDQNYGMWFVFDKEQELSFWMKNTLIPLDMIFVNDEFYVVDIVKNAQPCKSDPCSSYPADRPARYVLEINAGLSDLMGIEEGDEVEVTNF